MRPQSHYARFDNNNQCIPHNRYARNNRSLVPTANATSRRRRCALFSKKNLFFYMNINIKQRKQRRTYIFFKRTRRPRAAALPSPWKHSRRRSIKARRPAATGLFPPTRARAPSKKFCDSSPQNAESRSSPSPNCSAARGASAPSRRACFASFTARGKRGRRDRLVRNATKIRADQANFAGVSERIAGPQGSKSPLPPRKKQTVEKRETVGSRRPYGPIYSTRGFVCVRS